MSLFADINKKSDAEVIRLALSDPDCFAVIIDRYQPPLFRYIRRISSLSKEDIEDSLQEIFIKVYKNLNAYDDSLKFSSWIYRIAHNHVIDLLRKKNVGDGKNLSLEGKEFLNFLSSAVDIRKEIENKDFLERTKKTISELPTKYKEVLILRFLEDKSYEEIMDILRKPKGTVATLVSRGREMLKEKINQLKTN